MDKQTSTISFDNLFGRSDYPDDLFIAMGIALMSRELNKTSRISTPTNQPKDGYYLGPVSSIKIFDEFPKISELCLKYNVRISNDSKISMLYNNDTLQSNSLFRQGGSASEKFNDAGFRALIKYNLLDYVKLKLIIKDYKNGVVDLKSLTDLGTHVIINQKGEVCLDNKSTCEYPHIIGGMVGKLKNVLYNLSTKQPIAICSDDHITGVKDYIFAHKYDWFSLPNGDKFPLGVYKVELSTGVVTKIDDVK